MAPLGNSGTFGIGGVMGVTFLYPLHYRQLKIIRIKNSPCITVDWLNYNLCIFLVVLLQIKDTRKSQTAAVQVKVKHGQDIHNETTELHKTGGAVL